MKSKKPNKPQHLRASFCGACLNYLFVLELCTFLDWDSLEESTGVRVEGVLWVNLDPILLMVMGKSVYRPEGRVVFGWRICGRRG